MTRDFRAGFWTGAVLAIALGAGLVWIREGAKQAKADAEIAAITKRLARSDSANAALLQRNAELERTADSLRARANRAGKRLEAAATTFVVNTSLPPVGVTPAEGDTTKMGYITRKSDGMRHLVPLYFIETYQLALAAYDAEREARIYTERFVVTMKDELIKNLDGDRADALKLATLWERKANPKCGRRCGVLIGVGSTLGTAWLLSEVQDLVRAR